VVSVGVVNYGAGNVASVMKAVDYAGGNASVVSIPEEIQSCDKLILPGVGASGRAMDKLKQSGLDKALHEAVFKNAKPFLGICVGMQLLAEDLYEYGHHKGLGWIPGKVISLQDYEITDRPVPHMGWSDVTFDESMKDLGSKLGRHKSFYFAHSFTLVTDKKEIISSTVHYGRDLVSGIRFDTVSAFQFHPEKSQVSGNILMQWFMDWKP
jgi:glutamine amidotransferase